MSTPMSTPKQRKPRRPRSVVWYYFDKLPDDLFKAQCKLCYAICQHGTNTSNLFYHLKHRHPASFLEAESQREQETKLYMELKAKAGKDISTASATPTGKPRGRGRPPGSTNSKTKVDMAVVKTEMTGGDFSPIGLPGAKKTFSSFSMTPKVKLNSAKSAPDIQNALVKWLCMDLLPPSTIEKPGFQQFLSTCGVRPEVVPRKKLVFDALTPRLLESTRNRVKTELAAAQWVTLSLENWTYQGMHAFATLTAHCISDGWEMISRVVDTFDWTEEKTDTFLASTLKRITEEWGLSKKITVLLTDKPEEAISTAAAVHSWQEVTCFGHALNLVVTESLASVPEIVRVHKKLKEAVTYFYQSAKASDALSAVQNQHGLPSNRLKQEREGLWTSSVAAMARMVEQYEAVNTVLCFLGREHMCLCDDEVHLVRCVLEVLRPFEAAVAELCAEPYTCVSKLIPLASLLRQVTAAVPEGQSDTTSSNLPVLSALKSSLLSEMDSRMSGLEENPVLASATLLDPRFKHHAFTDSSALEAAQERLLSDTEAVLKESDTSPSTNGIPADTSANSSTASLWGMFDMKVVNAKALKTEVTEAKNETQRYYKEVNILRTADPLKWWSLNQVQFPHLKVLAKKFLCVPATAVDSNKLFTKHGAEFSQRREMFRPVHLSDMLFLNQNLR